MVDYTAIQKFITGINLHLSTFKAKADKLVNAVFRHLPVIFLQRTPLWPSRR
jgi:hypothetical protein